MVTVNGVVISSSQESADGVELCRFIWANSLYLIVRIRSSFGRILVIS